MASPAAQIQHKVLSPSDTPENCNPNVNKGPCKRKNISSPAAHKSTQGSESIINASKDRAQQVSVDLNLFSPPRKQICGSTRCVTKDTNNGAPTAATPKKFLGPKGCRSPPREASWGVNNSNDSERNDRRAQLQNGSLNPYPVCVQNHHMSDQSRKSAAVTGTASQTSLAPDHDEINGKPSSKTNIDSKLALSSTSVPKPKEAKFSGYRGKSSSSAASDEEAHSDKASSGRSETEEEEGNTEVGVPVSTSPEATGNWRLTAVLESFGNLTPLKEGRVKTLVRAFESLLSVSDKDKDDQDGEHATRSYPLQFSYLESAESHIHTRNKDNATNHNHSNAEDKQHWHEGEEHAEWNYTHERWHRHSTDGGRRKETIQAATMVECSRRLRTERNHVKVTGETTRRKDAAGIRLSRSGSAAQQLSGTQERNNQEDYADTQKPKQISEAEPQRLVSLQRFSMDGHAANAAARKQLCNGDRKPLAAKRRGSNFSISSARPPLAQKPQQQPAQEKLRPVKPQPFKLLTEERGHMKEQEFLSRLNKLLEEEERLRVPLAQGLPWTTDEPEVPYKPPAKESTIPLDIHLNSDNRAMDRAEFDRFVAEKLLAMEERRLEQERLRRQAEEEEIKRLRQEMVPKAQLMPYFDRPFRPQRSSKRPTVPKEPHFHHVNANNTKEQPKRQKCVETSIS
ncbi:hypothetical protein KP509_10G034200 [Ceratopteris richardii]|nr:hypothetical protein KP509_10G034200 [Ceratopteris richardii]